MAVETGTYLGINAQLYASMFKSVFTCETDETYYKEAKQRLKRHDNVYVFNKSSEEFLSYFQRDRLDTIFFYLDAHFYNPKHRWVVVDELKALENFKKCIICIHDFDNGLGHITYDNEPLGWNVVGKYIKKVNPDFHYYTNTKEMCDIVDKETVEQLPILVNGAVLEALQYTHSSDEKRYRGILYAVPRELDLSKYKLVKYEPRN